MDYDCVYIDKELYWGSAPSNLCYKALEIYPPTKKSKLLDIGAGEGRNSLFFARNGYDVTAVEISEAGVEKINKQAKNNNLKIKTVKADYIDFQSKNTEQYDVVFSVGFMHYVPSALRFEIFDKLKEYTTINGIHIMRTFVTKTNVSVEQTIDDALIKSFYSGELMVYYKDWDILLASEDKKECTSGGSAHKHVRNTVISRKVDSEFWRQYKM